MEQEQVGRFPFGDRTTRQSPSPAVSALRAGIASAALLLTACDSAPSVRAYWEYPSDPEVHAYLFRSCLDGSRPPGATHYNDQDEVVEACNEAAEDAARYCPKGAVDCAPEYRRTRDDVRTVLRAAIARVTGAS